MLIPKEILGKNRIRDFAICRDYIRGKLPSQILQERNIKLTVRRCEQIINKNKVFVAKYIGWNKSKRIWELIRMIDKAPETKKDKFDLMEQMRKEMEGDKPLIDNSQHIHVTNIDLKDKNTEDLTDILMGRYNANVAN